MEHRAKLADAQSVLAALPARGRTPDKTRKLKAKRKRLCSKIALVEIICGYAQDALLELEQREHADILHEGGTPPISIARTIINKKYS